MATRQQTTEGREALERQLRQSIWDGALVPGALAPSVTAIAQDYRVTRYQAHQAVANLIREGLFYTVPNIGTFVGAARPKERCEFWILNDVMEHHRPLRRRMRWSGAEESLAARGATVLLQSVESVRAATSNSRFDAAQIGGVIDLSGLTFHGFWSELGAAKSWQPPRVRFGVLGENLAPDGAPFDTVCFDDFAGGATATRHLLAQGHRNIGFVALHSPNRPENAPQWNLWSLQRAAGWQQTLANALGANALGADAQGEDAHGETADALEELRFWPDSPIAEAEDQNFLALTHHYAQTALILAARREVSALVVANDAVALALIENWQRAGIARAKWPAIVSFDGDCDCEAYDLTSLRLPWHDLGRAAADLLWARHTGELKGEPVQRKIAMKLIPRRSCRAQWHEAQWHEAQWHETQWRAEEP